MSSPDVTASKHPDRAEIEAAVLHVTRGKKPAEPEQVVADVAGQLLIPQSDVVSAVNRLLRSRKLESTSTRLIQAKSATRGRKATPAA